jgi:hypothetical protein
MCPVAREIVNKFDHLPTRGTRPPAAEWVSGVACAPETSIAPQEGREKGQQQCTGSPSRVAGPRQTALVSCVAVRVCCTYPWPVRFIGDLRPPGGALPDAIKVSLRPSRSALKADWVDYAVEVHGVDREAAEAMTEQRLFDL